MTKYDLFPLGFIENHVSISESGDYPYSYLTLSMGNDTVLISSEINLDDDEISIEFLDIPSLGKFSDLNEVKTLLKGLRFDTYEAEKYDEAIREAINSEENFDIGDWFLEKY